MAQKKDWTVTTLPKCLPNEYDLPSSSNTHHASKVADFIRAAFDEIVTLQVGEEAREFHVHKGVLCHRSEYFKALLSAEFAESKSKKIRLDMEDADVFETFICWLYTGQFKLVEEDCVVSPIYLCKLWCLGDRRQIPALMNYTMATLEDRTVKKAHILWTCVEYAYENSSVNSNLRRYLVDTLAFTTSKIKLSDKASSTDEWAEGFWRDLVVALVEEGRVSTSASRPRKTFCAYHEHNEDERCPQA